MAAKTKLLQSFECINFDYDGPDFTLGTGPYKWKVHSTLLSQYSDFFKAACSGKFKEASERTVNLPEANPFMVARMIQWLYCGSYDVKQIRTSFSGKTIDADVPSLAQLMKKQDEIADFETLKAEDNNLSEVMVHVHVYMLANQYQIQSLATEALRKLSESGIWDEKDFDNALCKFKESGIWDVQPILQHHIGQVAGKNAWVWNPNKTLRGIVCKDAFTTALFDTICGKSSPSNAGTGGHKRSGQKQRAYSPPPY